MNFLSHFGNFLWNRKTFFRQNFLLWNHENLSSKSEHQKIVCYSVNSHWDHMIFYIGLSNFCQQLKAKTTFLRYLWLIIFVSNYLVMSHHRLKLASIRLKITWRVIFQITGKSCYLKRKIKSVSTNKIWLKGLRSLWKNRNQCIIDTTRQPETTKFAS